MPIIIHREPYTPQPTAADDWDKAVGVVVMVATAFFLFQDLFFGGLLMGLANWLQGVSPKDADELTGAKHIIALAMLHAVMMGVMNLVVGWGIWLKARWAFLLGPLINLCALTGAFAFLGDESVEYIALAVGITGFCVARLFGALGGKV